MLQLVGWSGFVPPLGLDFGDTGLGGIESVVVDDMLMGGVGNDNIFIIVVVTCPAGWVPAELANIDGVSQDIFDRPVGKSVAPVSTDAHVVQFFCYGIEAVAGQKALKDKTDVLGFIIHDCQDVLFLVQSVAKWRGGLKHSVLSIYGHAPFYLAGEPVGIELVHPFDDALDEATKRAFRQRLGNAHHADAAFGAKDGFIEDALKLVSGETGELPYQDYLEGAVGRLRLCDYLLELGPVIGVFPGDAWVDIDMILKKYDAIFLGVLSDFFKLALRG